MEWDEDEIVVEVVTDVVEVEIAETAADVTVDEEKIELEVAAPEETGLEITEDLIELELIAEPEIVIETGEGSGKAAWGFITGELPDQTDLQTALDGKSNTGHTHDDRYYTEQEIDAALAVINAALSGKSDVGHVHDERYYTQSQTDAALAVINAALSGKSDVGHTHDDRYYTETEIDGLTQIINYELSKKSNTGHTHGNMTADGAILSDTAATSGDKLILADNSDSSKLIRSGISFDGATTTKGLTPKGTWESFAPASHTHDDRYYTEAEIDAALQVINTALSGKSDVGHTHDDRYYTESETDTALAGKADSSHNHSAGDITSGTIPIARGGTNAGDIINARKNLGFVGMFFAPAVFDAECNLIPRYSNLNTQAFCSTGKYYTPVNDDAGTLINRPTSFAFQMLVFNLLSNTTGQITKPWEYRLRIIMNYYGDIFVQTVRSDGNVNIYYNDWRQIAYL